MAISDLHVSPVAALKMLPVNCAKETVLSRKQYCPLPLPKMMSRIEASKSKNPFGDGLVGQNNDFATGWTSNIMRWDMLRNSPQKRGGAFDARACA